MNFRYYFLLTLLLLAGSNSFAQGWEYLFQDVNTNSRATHLIPTSDGNYLVGGFQSGGLDPSAFGSYLLKIDENGQVVWRQNYSNNPGGISEIAELSNNRYVFVSSYIEGSTPSPRLRIVDNTSNVILDSEITTGSGGGYGSHKIIAQSNGGFLYTFAKDGTQYIYQYDPNYNLTFSGSMSFDPGRLSSQLSNGNLLWLKSEAGSVFKYETDDQGSLLSTQTVAVGGNANLLIADNGGFAFTRTSADLNGAVVELFQYDSNNVEVDRDTIWDGSILDANDLQLTSDGYLISGFFGQTPDPTAGTAILIKTDTNGDIVFTHQATNQTAYSLFNQAIPSQSAGYLAIGEVGFKDYVVKLDANGVLFANTVNGSIAIDEIADCQVNAGETPASNWLVTATKNGNLFAATITDDLGQYQLQLDTGDFVLNAVAPNSYWGFCDNTIDISFTAFNQTAIQDFSLLSDVDCPAMEVNASVPWVQACESSTIYIDYCNTGTVFGADAYIELSLDTNLVVDSSSMPWSNISVDNVVTFDLGDVGPFDCGAFTVSVSLPCNAPVGSSYGVDAHIFPDTLCGPMMPGYSGAYLESDGICGDSVLFILENVGDSPMDMELDYFIVEDAVLMRMDDVPILDPMESYDLKLPANGATYTLVHEQVDMAPGMSAPIEIIEGCGTNGNGEFSTGYSQQFPLDDLNPFVDEERPINKAVISFNELMASPEGYGAEHFVQPGTTIEYLLPFQNTSGQNVEKLVIKDSLDKALDVNSIHAISSSHTYDLQINEEGVLIFTFENINLIGRSSSASDSEGFISFKVRLAADAPTGSKIYHHNFISFNDQPFAASSNTFHTIGEEFIEVLVVSTSYPDTEEVKVKIAPNPFSEVASIIIEGHQSNQYQLELYNSNGHLIRTQQFDSNTISIHRNQLSSGFYLYQLSSADGFSQVGKLIIR